MNDQQRQQVLEQLKTANNVLITVNANPSVDELAASIGLTIALNKMDKHATTVFSGVVPSTIEFLQPEKTIETTTDSLRDFIIALDKSKADKLRYKVEADVVRIFITPYRTTISDKDLKFSQGDFNVDAIVALGVVNKEHLDNAVTAHGRILHDAVVIAVTNRDKVSELGSINWQDKQAGSLCEMIAGMTSELKPDAIDGQMATALLTGIISETDWFKNEKTTPNALALSSKLLAAGANQQLIADKLEEPATLPAPIFEAASKTPLKEVNETKSNESDGELEISHGKDQDDSKEPEIDKIHIDEDGNISKPEEIPQYQPTHDDSPPVEPAVDAEEKPLEKQDTPIDSVDNKDEEKPAVPQDTPEVPTMHHEKVISPLSEDGTPKASDKPFDLNEAMKEVGSSGANQTLSDLEESVDSTKVQSQPKQLPPPPPVSDSDSSTTSQTQPKVLDQSKDPATLQPSTTPAPSPPTPPPPVPPPMTAPQFYDANGDSNNPFLNPSK